MGNLISNVLKYTFVLTLLFFLILILAGTFIYKSEFSMILYGDTSVLIKQNIPALITGVLFSTILFLLILSISFKDNSFDPIKDGWPLLVVNAIGQFLVIFFFNIKLTADWEVLYNLSGKILSNDYSAFLPEGYLYAYPHNLGITAYFAFLNKVFPGNIYIPKILNVFYSLITIILINKAFVLLKPEYESFKFHLFFISSTFIPGVFMSNLVYNEVPSTMLYMTSAYFLLLFVLNRNIKLLITVCVFLVAGNFIRSIGILFAFAFVVFMLVMKVESKKILLFVILVLIGFGLPTWLMNKYLISTDKIAEPLGKNSIPITKWLHLGLNQKYFGYWDQGESYYMYVQSGWDKKKADIKYREGIMEKIESYGFKSIANIYFKKLVWLWTEGTYQSVYLGMSHTNPGGYIKETPVSNYFNQNVKRRKYFETPMYFTNISALISITFFLLISVFTKKISHIGIDVILIIILTSFILFYLIWEVKPRYIFPVYPYILIFSFISFLKLREKNMLNTFFRKFLKNH